MLGREGSLIVRHAELFLFTKKKQQDENYKQNAVRNIIADQTQRERQSKMEKFCSQHMYDQSLEYGESFFYNDKRKFIFCRIPKVACTTWKKVLAYTLDMVDSPFNVSLYQVSYNPGDIRRLNDVVTTLFLTL